MFESINIFKIHKNLASLAHSEKCIRFVFHLCKCIMEYHKYKYWGGGMGFMSISCLMTQWILTSPKLWNHEIF